MSFLGVFIIKLIYMNRSYSKIRHIQESNQILEKRLLSEDKMYGKGRDERGILNFEFSENFVLLKDMTQKKVQQYLSKLHERVMFLAIVDCEGVDFSNVDICSFNMLMNVNLKGTPNNFNEFQNCGFKEKAPGFYSKG